MSQDVAEKVKEFFSAYQPREDKKGQILVHAGEDPAGIFYLTSGHVQAYDISDKGERVIVNIFKPLAFFPMSWAINKTPNEYFFEASTDITHHVAPADKVVNFLHKNPDITFDLLARVYSGTDGLLRRMAHMMGGTARSRLLFELLIQARRFGESMSNGSCLIKVSEHELAKRAGLTRETVSRVLATLKDLVSVKRDGLLIHNLTALEKELGGGL